MAKTANKTGQPADDIAPGVRFYFTYADSKPLWEVKRARGRDTWECEVIPEPITVTIGGQEETLEGDWVGTRKVFGGEDIRQSLKAEHFWQDLRRQHEDFYASLSPGQVVHGCRSRPYRDCPTGDFIRYRVVTDTVGDHKLLPIALVGTWRHDRPRRTFWGDVTYSTYANQIAAGKARAPNDTSIYESPRFAYRDECPVNPATLEPLDLTPRPRTPREEVAWRLHLVMEKVREALNQDRDWPRDLTEAQMTERYLSEQTAKLAELKQVVTKALAEPND